MHAHTGTHVHAHTYIHVQTCMYMHTRTQHRHIHDVEEQVRLDERRALVARKERGKT